MAMGAILGIAAFGRTQEKIAGANNGGAPALAGTPTAPVALAAAPTFSSVPAPTFSSAPAPVYVSSTGKPMPAPQIDPPL